MPDNHQTGNCLTSSLLAPGDPQLTVCYFYEHIISIMTSNTIAQLRFTNQHIRGNKFSSVKQITAWMGAIQAQDYAMAKYAIGIRLKNSTDKIVEEAINKGEIIRTHVLRPTWHFVAAEDIRWMLDLTAKNLNRSLSSNNKRLELDEKTFSKANKIIEKLLRDGKHLTRKEIMQALEKKGIRTDDLRAGHIMFRAETDLIVCNGIKRDKQFTYALFDERVPYSKKLAKEEALAQLTLRYFFSHGPATLKDFSWWSGLSLKDATTGLESVKLNLTSEKYKDNFYLFAKQAESKKNSSITLFPAYDEFLISYKSREISVDTPNLPRTFTNNGIFNPVIIHNAKVIGTWKPQYKKDLVIIPYFFNKPAEKQKEFCRKAAKEFGKFLEKPVTLL